MKNLNFEGGSYKYNGINELNIPSGWGAGYIEDKKNKIYRPETKLARPPYSDAFRIHSGVQSLQMFKQFGAFNAWVSQESDGYGELTVSVWGMIWYSQYGDKYKSEWNNDGVRTRIPDGDQVFTQAIGIDPECGDDINSESIIWSYGHYYDHFGRITAKAKINGKCVVYLRAFAKHPFEHTDCWFDNVTTVLEAVGETDLPDYERTFHLLPQNIDLSDAKLAHGIVHPQRGTMGYAKEDAVNVLKATQNNVVMYFDKPTAWGSDDVQYIKKFGAKVSHVHLHDTTPPTEPPVDPPVEPPQNNYLRSKNQIGLHSGYQKSGWDNYLTEALPTIQKCFSCGFALEAKQKAHDALVVWRRHSDNDVSINDAPGKLVDFYDIELAANARSMNISKEELLDMLDGVVIESLNEQIPTFNENQIVNAVSFDEGFAYEVNERFGGKLRPGVLTVAIGNPHESEVNLLLPAVRAAIKTSGYIGYHAYWTANRNRDYLEEHWKYHAGRWTEWDKIFNLSGLYPNYYLGEGGIVYSDHGNDFHSGRGWKSCGSFEKYLESISVFNSLVNEWNESHNYRCHGLTIFGYGNWGWPNFEFNEGDLNLLKTWAKTIL